MHASAEVPEGALVVAEKITASASWLWVLALGKWCCWSTTSKFYCKSAVRLCRVGGRQREGGTVQGEGVGRTRPRKGAERESQPNPMPTPEPGSPTHASLNLFLLNSGRRSKKTYWGCQGFTHGKETNIPLSWWGSSAVSAPLDTAAAISASLFLWTQFKGWARSSPQILSFFPSFVQITSDFVFFFCPSLKNDWAALSATLHDLCFNTLSMSLLQQ